MSPISCVHFFQKGKSVTGGRQRRSAAEDSDSKAPLASDLGLQWHFTLNAGPSDSCDCTFYRLLRRISFEANHPQEAVHLVADITSERLDEFMYSSG